VFYNFAEQDYILSISSAAYENCSGPQGLFDYKPSEEVTIYFNDSDDYATPAATALPTTG